MSTIIIKRTSEYANRLRNYRLFLDGKEIGTIANGQTEEFETSPGPHILVAKIDWCSSPEISFTLQESEQKKLTVGAFKNGNWIMPVAMSVIALHFILGAVLDFRYARYTIILIIPAFILLLYYLTVGHKRYLALTEA